MSTPEFKTCFCGTTGFHLVEIDGDRYLFETLEEKVSFLAKLFPEVVMGYLWND
jgi:hypothetical protein